MRPGHPSQKRLLDTRAPAGYVFWLYSMPALYLDVSLSLDENLRVKEFRRREVENGRDGLSPLFSLLSVTHCASSPVTRVSLEFRALLCVKNEVTTSVFNGLFETSSSTRATVSKQTVQNVLMATVEFH